MQGTKNIRFPLYVLILLVELTYAMAPSCRDEEQFKSSVPGFHYKKKKKQLVGRRALKLSNSATGSDFICNRSWRSPVQQE